MTGQVILQLIEIMGEGPALKLMSEFGGTHIYVPIRPKNKSRLVKMLGLDAVRSLSQHFGGDKLAVPLGNTIKRAARNAEIMRASETMSRNKVARLYGTTERSVRRIDNQEPHTDPRQPNLFDE